MAFSLQFHTLAHQDKSTWLELYKNSDYIASVFGHTANDYASAGNSVVLQLANGDQVKAFIIYLNGSKCVFNHMVFIEIIKFLPSWKISHFMNEKLFPR